jgi:hypothetical protein
MGAREGTLWGIGEKPALQQFKLFMDLDSTGENRGVKTLWIPLEGFAGPTRLNIDFPFFDCVFDPVPVSRNLL